ncbi:hypothetical protein BKA60DRAFT_549161 [Fusarium oxysporum]|nr:hypothetical protein BKA60DRAFT_549161 [Fusarium oxysporum]
MGYSASAFAVGGDQLLQRPGRHHDLASRAGPCGIKDGAPVSCMVVEIYVRASGQIDLSPQHVDQITSRSRFQEKGSEKNSTLMLTLIDDRDELRKKRQPKQQSELPFAISYIFMAASDEQEGKEDFLMLAAAKVFNVMIEGGAGELVLGVVRDTYGFQVEFATEDDSDASGSADEAET